MIGWDGKIIPNASLELEVYVSNESHPLHIFEYTKENNAKGLQFTIPAPEHGWREHTWHSISVPIAETAAGQQDCAGRAACPAPGSHAWQEAHAP